MSGESICEDCNAPPHGGLIRTDACADMLGCCNKMVCANGCKLVCPQCNKVMYGYRMHSRLAKCRFCSNIFNVPNFHWYGNSISEHERRYDGGNGDEEYYANTTYSLCGCGNIALYDKEFCELCYSIQVMLCLQKVGLLFDLIQLLMRNHLKWDVMYPVRRL